MWALRDASLKSLAATCPSLVKKKTLAARVLFAAYKTVFQIANDLGSVILDLNRVRYRIASDFPI